MGSEQASWAAEQVVPLSGSRRLVLMVEMVLQKSKSIFYETIIVETYVFKH